MPSSINKYVVEAIGTFFLVFTIITAVNDSPELAALAIGSVLMVMIYAGGHISGGHFNPAVSLAAWIRGRLDTADLAPYVAAQVVGAAIAAGIGSWIFDDINTPDAFEGKDLAVAFVVEFLFTFALAWVVLNVATSKDHPNNSFYGLAIGFTVVAGAVAVGPLSGGAFNPAVAVGISIAGLTAWANIWIYLVACLAGGAAAGFVFKALQPEDV